MTDYVQVKCPDCGRRVDIPVTIAWVDPRRAVGGLIRSLAVQATGTQLHPCTGRTSVPA